MDETGRRLRRIRHFALALTALSLLVVLVSAYIRLSGAGLGCSPWPECYGQILGGGPHPNSGGVRVLHRVLASLALLLACALVWQCLRPEPIEASKRTALAVLAMMILLAVVGIFSATPQRVWAGFINILGGAGLVLLSWRCYLVAQDRAAPVSASRGAVLLHTGLGLLILTMALGALIGARYAAPACSVLPGCGDAVTLPGAGWSALNPLATIVAPAGPGDAGGALLHVLHRAFAVACVLLLGLAGLRALGNRPARIAAGLMLLLLFVQSCLGVLAVMSGFALGLTVAHAVCAVALLTSAMHVLRQVKAGPV